MAVANVPDEFEVVSHTLVADLHSPRPWVFWTDLTISAALGWTAFALAVQAPRLSATMWMASLIAACTLYRGVCFTHELAHLRRRAVPGFETAWNILFGVPLFNDHGQYGQDMIYDLQFAFLKFVRLVVIQGKHGQYFLPAVYNGERTGGMQIRFLHHFYKVFP